MNDIFVAPETREPFTASLKRIHDQIKDKYRLGGARLGTPLEKAYDTATELMKNRLSHTNGEEQFLDQISDLRVIQFHAYNHFMGYLQNCLNDPLQPLGHLPHFNQALVNDLKERHREFTTNFLHYAQNKAFEKLGVTPEQFRQDCQEPLGRIGDFICTGTFNPQPTNEGQGLVGIVNNYLIQALAPQIQVNDAPRTATTEEEKKDSPRLYEARASQLSPRSNSLNITT